MSGRPDFGLGVRVQGLGFTGSGSGCRVWGLPFGFQGLGFTGRSPLKPSTQSLTIAGFDKLRRPQGTLEIYLHWH